MIRSTADVPYLASSSDSPRQFGNHARLLAVVAAFNHNIGPMPWLLVNEVMERVSGPAAFEGAGEAVRTMVAAIAHDLHQAGLLSATAHGEVVPARGQVWIEDHRDMFDELIAGAHTALLDLGFAVKDPPPPERPVEPLSEERLEAIRSRWQGIGLVTDGLPQGVRAKTDVDRLLAEIDRLRALPGSA